MRMNLVNLLPAGNQAKILSFLPKVLLRGHTSTVRTADSHEKKHSGKANCPSDNEEIQNYCWLAGKMKTEVLPLFKKLTESALQK